MKFMNALAVARLSLWVGILVFALKWLAYWLTGSVALYSDALESIVNIAAATTAFFALWISQQPADSNHPYGHTKVEYFSAIVEGTLIIVAAVAIIHEAWGRLWAPVAIMALGVGLSVSLLASLLNASLAAYLLYASRRFQSPALKADGMHILSDVITSVGVLIGVSLAWWSGAWILDPLLALVVAMNIIWMGWKLLRESIGGLMDEGMNAKELTSLHQVITAEMGVALQVHDIKTRRAGRITFIQLHLVVPSAMTVKDAHDICDQIEIALSQAVNGAEVTIHLEPETEAQHRGSVLLNTQSRSNRGRLKT